MISMDGKREGLVSLELKMSSQETLNVLCPLLVTK